MPFKFDIFSSGTFADSIACATVVVAELIALHLDIRLLLASSEIVLSDEVESELESEPEPEPEEPEFDPELEPELDAFAAAA